MEIIFKQCNKFMEISAKEMLKAFFNLLHDDVLRSDQITLKFLVLYSATEKKK